MAKTFERGEQVEVQREAGYSVPWEVATYQGPVVELRGYHAVDLAQSSKPRFIDRRTGMEIMEPDEHTFETHRLLVPARRIRAAKASIPSAS